MAIGIDPDLLARHVRGDCSFSEQRQVREWLAASPANAQELAFWRTLWESSARLHTDAMPGERNPAHAVARIRARIAAPRRLGAPPHPSYRPGGTGRLAHLWPRGAGGSARSVPRVWTFAVAGVLVLVGALAVRRSTMSDAMPRGASVRVYATRPGQRATIMLGDGSRVVLAVATTLRVPEGISTGARDVVLDGEAYFTVRHDATRPFRVRTRTAVTEDLGTEFAVRAYPGDSGVQVAVLSGSVAVGPGPAAADHRVSKRPLLVLTAGQLGRLDSAGAREERETVDVALYLAWTKGRLVFRDTPLREVARVLSRWYDLDVTVADTAIAERRLTASFTTEPVGQVLNFIAPAVDARLEQHGRSVQLYALRRSTP